MAPLSNSDVIALLAAFVAALALVATIWQAVLARRHNRLSVRPHLDWFRERTPGRNPALRIVNCGLGPAIIDSVQIHYADKLFEVSGPSLCQELATAIDQAPFFTEWDIYTPGTPVKAGQELTFFECAIDKAQLSEHSAALALLDRIGIVINYRSMYHEPLKLHCPPEREA